MVGPREWRNRGIATVTVGGNRSQWITVRPKGRETWHATEAEIVESFNVEVVLWRIAAGGTPRGSRHRCDIPSKSDEELVHGSELFF